MLLGIISIIGLVCGLGFGFILFRLFKNLKIKYAHVEALEIIAEANEVLELRALEEKEIQQEIELELWTKSELDLLKYEESIEELTELVDEKKKKNDLLLQEDRKRISSFEQEVLPLENNLKVVQEKHQARIHSLKEMNHALSLKLSERSSLSREDAKAQIIEQFENEMKLWAQNWIDKTTLRRDCFVALLLAMTRD